MSRNGVKWTHQIRLMLYELVTISFGSYDTWQLTDYPSSDLQDKEQYLDSLRRFAVYCQQRFGVKFGKLDTDGVEAVRQQIAYATTSQDRVDGGRIKTWFGNKAAALEAGFIDSIGNVEIEDGKIP